MTISKVGRPSIENSEVPPHIEEALLHKSRGKTWADSATAVGLKKYQTLKEWVNKNEKAKSFYKEAVQERQEKIQEFFFGICLGTKHLVLLLSEK